MRNLREFAFGHDDLSPLSKGFSDGRNGWGEYWRSYEPFFLVKYDLRCFYCRFYEYNGASIIVLLCAITHHTSHAA